MVRIVSTSGITTVPLATATPQAASDTWGISGPIFLTGFTVAAIVVLGGTALALGLIPHLGFGGADVVRTDPTPTQLAMTSGGEDLALAVALADLRQRSLLGTDAEPRRRGKVVSVDLTGLSRAVHDAVTVRGVPATITRLKADPEVAAELARTRSSVRALGLVLTSGQRRAQAWCALAPVALIAVGIARVVAGRANGKPVGGLVVLLVVGLAVSIGLIGNALKRPFTPRGRALLAELRHDNRHLTPRLQPSWETYGPSSLLLGTALFGGVALFSADPAFAQSVGARMIPAAGQTQAFGAAGSNSTSGSGCSSGSSCSGGSSCGGGGCGGGGCGG